GRPVLGQPRQHRPQCVRGAAQHLGSLLEGQVHVASRIVREPGLAPPVGRTYPASIMASASATLEDFATGDLPPICVKSGVDTRSFTRIRITSAPGWTWILILLGVLPFLIVRYFFTKSAAGRVPVSEEVGRRVRNIQWVLLAVFLAGVALIVVG